MAIFTTGMTTPLIWLIFQRDSRPEEHEPHQRHEQLAQLKTVEEKDLEGLDATHPVKPVEGVLPVDAPRELKAVKNASATLDAVPGDGEPHLDEADHQAEGAATHGEGATSNSGHVVLIHAEEDSQLDVDDGRCASAAMPFNRVDDDIFHQQ
jgi:hypothetical protein